MALSPEEKRERQIEAKRRYNARNVEKRAEYRKKWRAENPEKRYAETKRHREKYPDKRKEWDAEYRRLHREILAEKQKEYYQKNPTPPNLTDEQKQRYKEKHRVASRKYMAQVHIIARNTLREKFGMRPPIELEQAYTEIVKINRQLRKMK